MGPMCGGGMAGMPMGGGMMGKGGMPGSMPGNMPGNMPGAMGGGMGGMGTMMPNMMGNMGGTMGNGMMGMGGMNPMMVGALYCRVVLRLTGRTSLVLQGHDGHDDGNAGRNGQWRNSRCNSHHKGRRQACLLPAELAWRMTTCIGTSSPTELLQCRGRCSSQSDLQRLWHQW